MYWYQHAFYLFLDIVPRLLNSIPVPEAKGYDTLWRKDNETQDEDDCAHLSENRCGYLVIPAIARIQRLGLEPQEPRT